MALAGERFAVREYGFELRLCAHLETVSSGIIARQLGGGVHEGGGRILDVVAIEPGPAFDRRRDLAADTIPSEAIESPVGPGRASRWPGEMDVSPEIADRVLAEAVRVGFFEHERRNGRDYVRQTIRYPDWIGKITAIENKPSLDAPGDLLDQLRHDVSLGLVDQVILATASHVTGAHLNRIPREVGVWRVRREEEGVTVDVRRDPTPLDPAAWGIEVHDRSPLATAIRPVSPAAKARARTRLAERAYGKGWRPAFPACSEARVASSSGTPSLPYCDWKDRVVDSAGCGPACPGHTPADPPVSERAAERASRTAWDANPTGFVREQASLVGFERGEETRDSSST